MDKRAVKRGPIDDLYFGPSSGPDNVAFGVIRDQSTRSSLPLSAESDLIVASTRNDANGMDRPRSRPQRL